MARDAKQPFAVAYFFPPFELSSVVLFWTIGKELVSSFARDIRETIKKKSTYDVSAQIKNNII